MKKVSAIIVNYNTKDILLNCIKNLKEIGYQNLEVIVVDNGSTDGSYEAVRDKFPDVKAIQYVNKGLAAGCNRGLKIATGEYILYLGSDAFPEKGTIEEIVNYMEQNPKVGAATCKLVLRDGSLDMDAHRGFPTPWASLTHFTRLNKLFPKSKIFNQYFIGWEDLNKPHEIDLCIAHFMMVKKEVFEKVGEWDENYFVYGEDVDMCYRIKQAGYKIMYLPLVKALHYKGASVGIRKESTDIAKTPKETRIKMSKSRTESMRRFYKKHYSKKYNPIITGIVLLGVNVLEKIRLARTK